jgi:hypothetical protein
MLTSYDGEDIFPRKLWDPNSPFLKALDNQLNPEHGTVVVNLHSDSELLNSAGSAPSILEQVLPMGKYVSRIGRAYKDMLVGNGSCGRKEGSGLGPGWEWPKPPPVGLGWFWPPQFFIIFSFLFFSFFKKKIYIIF